MNKYRKWLSLTLVVSFLAGLLCCAPASAESLAPGAAFQASFTLADNPGHAVAALVELDYDHSVLTLIPDIGFRSDRRYLFGDLTDLTVGTSITASFQLSTQASDGVYPVRLNVLEAYDYDEQAVSGLRFTEHALTVQGAAPAGPAATGANDFSYEIVDGGAKIKKYLGEATEVTVPDTLEGFPVVSIGGRAFSERWDLTSVFIPSSVTFISTTAFAGVRDFTVQVLEGSYAHRYCVGQGYSFILGEPDQATAGDPAATVFIWELEDGAARIVKYIGDDPKAVIPDTIDGYPVTQIGSRAFSDRPGVTHVIVPSGVTFISSTAFAGCRKVVLSVSRDSYAETYCQKKKIPYISR